jgi:hypothetical protein
LSDKRGLELAGRLGGEPGGARLEFAMGEVRSLTSPSPRFRILSVSVVGTPMFEKTVRTIALLAAAAVLASSPVFSQEPPDLTPPPYGGVTAFVDGIFVTPVPGAPLTAVVEVESTQVLADGSALSKKSIANIARDSQGRIYNERRQLVSPSYTGHPPILSVHIFDPETRLSIFVNPATRIARQFTLSQPIPRPPTNGEDLGSQVMENVLAHGIRVTRTVLAAASGTGKPVIVTDEYWYSDELHLNMLVKHDDPRTGQQTVSVTRLSRTEPDEAVFKVPAGFKIVDETPETQNRQN